MNKLHTRKLSIYTDNICKICNREIDQDLHPFLCGINHSHLRNKFLLYLTEECASRTNGNKQLEPIKNRWKQSQIFQDYEEDKQTWHSTEWKDILRGAITHKILRIAEKITGNSSTAQ